MKDQNENLKSLINLQLIIKNLLIKELDDIKNKIHNITLNNYNKNSINPKNSQISKKLMEEKNSVTPEESIIKKNLIICDEDGTPIYHDEDHNFDFDDFFEKKPEIENKNISVMNDVILNENIALYSSIAELNHENKSYQKLVQDLRIDNNEKNQKILRLQDELTSNKKTMNKMRLSSIASDYHSNNQEANLIQNIKGNEETNEKREIIAPKRLKTNSLLTRKKTAKKYSHTHKIQCLAAGIPTFSTLEQLEQKQAEIKAKRKVKTVTLK